MNAAEAAKLVGCSGQTICDLIRKGHIKAEHVEGSNRWNINLTKKELRDIVNTHAPKYGFKKNGTVTRTDSIKSIKSVKLRKDTNDGLAQLMIWAQIPQEKRQLLLKVAEKFSVDDLQLILEL